jgi:hypothetical protein
VSASTNSSTPRITRYTMKPVNLLFATNFNNQAIEN